MAEAVRHEPLSWQLQGCLRLGARQLHLARRQAEEPLGRLRAAPQGGQELDDPVPRCVLADADGVVLLARLACPRL
eukprot:8128572-Lingulodinium_polyedra.AAC.1